MPTILDAAPSNSTSPSRAPASPRGGGVWSYVSPSRLNLWLKCPLAWRLRYRDGIESPMSTAQFIGRRVHAALEQFYRHRQLGVHLATEDVIAAMHATWSQAIAADVVTFANAADEQACRAQTVNLVATYLEQLPSDEPPPLAVETAFEAPLVDPDTGEDLGLPLVGVVDLVLDDAAGPTIVDFKTASRGGDVAEVLHEVQLTSYAWLFRHHNGHSETALEIRNLVKTKTPKVETHRYAPRAPRHFRRLFAVIRAYLDDLDRGRFVYRPGFTCGSCEFHDTHCRSWSG